MGQARHFHRPTKAERREEIASRWRYHRSGCVHCEKFNGHSHGLGVLCIKGSQLFKDFAAVDLAAGE